jgi:hypothetical protein
LLAEVVFVERSQALNVLKDITQGCVDIDENTVLLIDTAMQSQEPKGFIVCIKDAFVSMHINSLKPILEKYGLLMKQEVNSILIYKPNQKELPN